MNRRYVGYAALSVSVVYYSILASFIGQGLFADASLVERYLIVTTLFLMIIFNVFIGSYILGTESKIGGDMLAGRSYRLERIGTIDEAVSHKLNNLNQVTLGYLNMLEKQNISDRGRDYLKRAIATIRSSGKTVEILKRIKNMENYEIEECNPNTILSDIKNKYMIKKNISVDVQKDLVIKATPLIVDACELLFSSGNDLTVTSREDSDSVYLIFKGVETDVDVMLVGMIVEEFGNVLRERDGITLQFPK
ncbi:MAG: hypothetical protein U9N35_02025 [Euryarchaeota archaeon]|nr:hypothetical protein [Euryarchaeota archaeon]